MLLRPCLLRPDVLAVLALAAVVAVPRAHTFQRAPDTPSSLDDCADRCGAPGGPDCLVAAPDPCADAHRVAMAAGQYRRLAAARRRLAAARSPGAARHWRAQVGERLACYRQCYLEVTSDGRGGAHLPAPDWPTGGP